MTTYLEIPLVPDDDMYLLFAFDKRISSAVWSISPALEAIYDSEGSVVLYLRDSRSLRNIEITDSISKSILSASKKGSVEECILYDTTIVSPWEASMLPMMIEIVSLYSPRIDRGILYVTIESDTDFRSTWNELYIAICRRFTELRNKAAIYLDPALEGLFISAWEMAPVDDNKMGIFAPLWNDTRITGSRSEYIAKRAATFPSPQYTTYIYNGNISKLADFPISVIGNEVSIITRNYKEAANFADIIEKAGYDDI